MSVQGTRLLFRTNPGGAAVPGGTTVDLTSEFPRGVCIASYPAIRMASGNRFSAELPVTIRLVLVLNNEQFSCLDTFTLLPGGQYSAAYNVPGTRLKVFAETASGSGNAFVDFALFGFAPYNA